MQHFTYLTLRHQKLFSFQQRRRRISCVRLCFFHVFFFLDGEESLPCENHTNVFGVYCRWWVRRRDRFSRQRACASPFSFLPLSLEDPRPQGALSVKYWPPVDSKDDVVKRCSCSNYVITTCDRFSQTKRSMKLNFLKPPFKPAGCECLILQRLTLGGVSL